MYIIAAAVFWGNMGVFAKALQALGLSSPQIALLRALTSFLFITVLIACTDRGLFKIKLRDTRLFLGTGIISYFLFNSCYFTAVREIGVAVSSALLATSPVFVTIMSCILFGEKMTVKKTICLLFAVCGCIFVSRVVSGNTESISLFGVVIGITAGFAYALYSVFSTYALRKYKPLTVTFYTFLFGTIASFIVGNPMMAFTKVANVTGIFWTLALGVFAGALPYFLYTLGLKQVEASRAAVIGTIEPVVASFLGIVLFREHVDIFIVLGICLIIAASAIVNMHFAKNS